MDKITKNQDKIENSKAFHIIGMDILIDKKNNAWLMEINANPSMNMFLEREIPGGEEGDTEKILQELDKYVKERVITEAIRIVSGEGQGEFEDAYE